MSALADVRIQVERSAFGALVGVILLVASFVVIYPLIVMIAKAFYVGGEFSLRSFQEVFGDRSMSLVLWNTLVLVGTSTILAIVIGAIFAWLNERTDANFGTLSDLFPMIPLLVPLVASAIGWVFLLAPSAGLINVAIRGLLGLAGITLTGPVFNIYSMQGMIFVTTLCLVPYVYLMVSVALRNLDPALDEASRVSGAPMLRTLLRVTFPLVLPSLGAAAILTIIIGFALFSVPVVIGTGARIDVLSVRIYRLLHTSYPPRMDVALTMSLFMVFVVQAAVLMQAVLVRRGRHAVIGGRGQRHSQIELGRLRILARLAMWFYIAATTILPVLGLVLVSLQPYWSPDLNPALLSLRNFRVVLIENSLTSRAFLNSILLGVVGGSIAIFIATIITLFIQRFPGFFGRLADGIATLPSAIPHTVVAVGFLLTFAVAPFNLHGSFAILILAYLMMFLPQAVRSTNAAASQVGRELLEASHVFGGSPAKTYRAILLPLMLPGLVSGWIILFALIMGELTASALLATSRTPVVGQVMLDLWDSGTFPQIAALAVLITALNTIVVAGVLRLTRTKVAA